MSPPEAAVSASQVNDQVHLKLNLAAVQAFKDKGIDPSKLTNDQIQFVNTLFADNNLEPGVGTCTKSVLSSGGSTKSKVDVGVSSPLPHHPSTSSFIAHHQASLSNTMGRCSMLPSSSIQTSGVSDSLYNSFPVHTKNIPVPAATKHRFSNAIDCRTAHLSSNALPTPFISASLVTSPPIPPGMGLSKHLPYRTTLENRTAHPSSIAPPTSFIGASASLTSPPIPPEPGLVRDIVFNTSLDNRTVHQSSIAPPTSFIGASASLISPPIPPEPVLVRDIVFNTSLDNRTVHSSSNGSTSVGSIRVSSSSPKNLMGSGVVTPSKNNNHHHRCGDGGIKEPAQSNKEDFSDFGNENYLELEGSPNATSKRLTLPRSTKEQCSDAASIPGNLSMKLTLPDSNAWI